MGRAEDSFAIFGSLNNAHMLIEELPTWINSDIAYELQVAALEDWLTNVRLICEFYRISGREKKSDFSVLNFLDSFEVKEEVAKELNDLWMLASKHISHLTNERIPIAGIEVKVFDFSLANLSRICGLIHQVREDFENRRQGRLIKEPVH